MTVISVLTVQVPADRRPEVVAYYESARILEESGAASARTCVSAIDAGRIVVIAEWADAAAYDAWLAAPVRTEFSQGILEAAGGSVTSTSEMFEVVHAV